MFLDILIISVVTIAAWYKTHTHIHHLQQISYKNKNYIKWRFGNYTKIIRPHEVLFIGGVFLTQLTDTLWSRLIGLLLILIDVYFFHLIRTAYAAKKKLKYTPRVKRLLVTNAIQLIGLMTLTFFMVTWASVILILALYLFGFITVIASNLINKPMELTINNWYYNDAHKTLAKVPNLTIIGITGSYGKTSTKNVLNAMLSKDFNVLMTPESFNTKMGLTRAIREHMKPTHEIFIAEMGADHVGDIKELMEFVQPSLGIITSIGPQHLDTFKTFENIVNEKGNMFRLLKTGGTAFVNVTDSNIVGLPRRSDLNYVSFSAQPDGNIETPDFNIESISVNSKGSSFTLVHKPSGKKVRLTTQLLGRHNLANIVAGAAVAINLGIPMDRLPYLTMDLKPVDHRLSIRRVNDHYTVLDDAFNSNPVGSRMALEVLDQFEGNQKIIITPGMIGLGDRHYELNKAFGVNISKTCDFTILVGKHQTRPIQDGLEEGGYNPAKLYVAKSTQDAFSKLSEIVKQDDVVLLENDLPDTFNE
ncbi:Mur ligase family protein [Fusibacter tunisiensis]|uniref:UDP-N-acetylmuramoyl-tripeptide--D-alanyl-D-alanine ligase n=1 Tax=Fusibacter tunisiensis TaxID=1008308 RepID=A0ABS2MPE4_9FIRM|nr:UDP-N-acetylmuramoyl-tripeptide--D-alanyl-D-alanine ligase [Fusibacter tunisiensis]MBM7561277.1 UDP-N-acetylmuramoyl-tripeptide--D-alanyl-D-alanine ligase [Fusibacter tunisiensis]